MNNKFFVGGALILGVAAFFIFKFQSASEPKPTSNPTPSVISENIYIRPHSPTFGNAMAKVTVIEWFDPECESCRVIHPIVKKIISDYKDRVHFVLRYMPYHHNSMYASSVLEEAKEMGKYEEALNILFEKQPEWGNHHNPQPDLIPQFLTAIGIPKEQLERESVIKKHGEKIKIDQTDGEKAGVRGTPTFFVNGRMLNELGDQPLRSAIEAALQQ